VNKLEKREIDAFTEETLKMKAQKILKIAAPIGDNPPEDIDLKQRIEKLGNNASITAIFEEMDRWEDDVVLTDRQFENTNLTGRLTKK
jgi:hypothetical protein